MPVSDHDQLVEEISRFRLAESDMEQAAAAAHRLQDVRGGPLGRALETAVAVCYARPFTKDSRRRRLDPEEWAPPERAARALHSQLLDLRDKLYAHTDPGTGSRQVIDVRTLIADDEDDIPSRRYVEEHRELRRDVLPRIIALAEERGATFSAQADEREFQLGRLRPDPSGEGWNIGG